MMADENNNRKLGMRPLLAPDSTPEAADTSHRNMASTRRGPASETARRTACRATAVTCTAMRSFDRGDQHASSIWYVHLRCQSWGGASSPWKAKCLACLSVAAMLFLKRKQGRTWPLKGPYTSSCRSKAAPPPLASRWLRFSRASTCRQTEKTTQQVQMHDVLARSVTCCTSNGSRKAMREGWGCST